ncbi:MAG: type I-U CRISPR-associated helicase/endonuclease Cas3 [Myxococcales bacterium]|nr:type I-U CRISPR-associated helicase/endonuclease Cas3 [Myxococcales bacterium]
MSFDDKFKRLTGETPFPWQAALYERLVLGDVPRTCDIPTGLGKTSVIAIWLLAMLAGARVPRRLVYVVNRRTVVDQTTAEVEKIRGRLAELAPEASLALSTLRGAFADNREWSADPSRPAVISGTVDMIGSRLLFSGYGIGFRSRPLHAGFLGQDALLVHDEAHLEPAFQQLVEAIEREQRSTTRKAPDLAPLRVMALTATSRAGTPDFSLGEADRVHAVVRQRLAAHKALTLHHCEKKALADRIAEIALQHRDSGRAILVFARTVEDVEKIGQRLAKEKLAHARLTGTMRGRERDALVHTPIFARFRRSEAKDTRTVYLVCTSAGEVGVNISADHLVCDLSTFDSMAQRFGRLNRFGARSDSRADVVVPTPLSESEKFEAPLTETLALLERLHGDVSPAALSQLPADQRARAFAPEPVIPPASDILFDAWALTTVQNLPGRPPVAAYLHGVEEWEPPRTQVAFRTEVGLLTTGALRAKYPPASLLDDYPLKPHELLSDTTSRVFDRLKKMAAKSREGATTPVWLVHDDGRVTADVTLETLLEGEREALEGLTVVLPPLGGLSPEGFLDPDTWGSASADEASTLDVADAWLDENGAGRRARTFAASGPAGMRLIRRIDLTPVDDDEDEAPSVIWSWYEVPRGADNQGSRLALGPVLLDVHLGDTERVARRIVAGVDLPADLRECVALAARIHDIGKRRRLWQRSIGNDDPSLVLAKSGSRTAPRDVTGYRHELGSVLDAESSGVLSELDPQLHPLLLHLVAAHHGRARPHFPARELFDPEVRHDFPALGVQVLTRFADLQAQYGRWGLAYLESLLRSADYEASIRPSSFAEVSS